MGLIFLLMLMIPNIIWTKNKPKDYEKYAAKENKFLLMCERVGEAAVCVCALIFSDLNPKLPLTPWSVWLFAAAALMLLYEIFWVRYFKSEKTMKDFYSSLLGIPVAGATLPVLAFALLGIYGKNPLLLVSVAVLGVGHIGIHISHSRHTN